MTERQEQMIYDEGRRRGFKDGYEACRDEIAEKMKEVADRPKGEWIEGKYDLMCSNCENTQEYEKFPYCPYCGADMRQTENEDEKL